MKKRTRKFFQTLFWLVIIGIGLWVAFAPPHRYEPQNIRVKVEQPPPPLPPPAPEPQPQAVTAPPVGDEKTEAQVATIAPLPLGPETHPMVHHGMPKIAVVIDDVGLDVRDSRKAIALPPFVTLSFMPYAMQLKTQTRQAHEAGHELMLHMPMEPVGHEDPGPGALLTNLPKDELRRRFVSALASFTGFDGVNNHMGSKFTADTDGMEMVIGELKDRHLFFLNSRTSSKTVGETIARQQGLPTISRDVFLDDQITATAIKNQMEQAERIARRKGIAVVIGHPHPVTLEVLAAWFPDAMARGFEFVPLKDLLPPP